jgi:septation ring formation regulator EzrA
LGKIGSCPPFFRRLVTEKDQLEILLEDIRGKFDLVLEGHDVLRKEIQDARRELGDKISLVDFKIEAVAADVKAHRADTEAHRPVYRVKE